MKSRKKVISIILGLMLLLQYVITPVGAIAGAINEETNDSDIILSQFKIDESESNADLMTFDLSLKINQSILKSKTTIIELDKSIKINESKFFKSSLEIEKLTFTSLVFSELRSIVNL